MGIMYQSTDASGTYYPAARDSVTSVVLAVIIASILYFFTAVFSEIFILATEAQREKQLKSAAARKSGRKNVDSGFTDNAMANLKIPTGLAQGSIYERAAMQRQGGFSAGNVETSINPLALQQAGQQGGAAGDISGNVVDSVAGMSGECSSQVNIEAARCIAYYALVFSLSLVTHGFSAPLITPFLLAPFNQCPCFPQAHRRRRCGGCSKMPSRRCTPRWWRRGCSRRRWPTPWPFRRAVATPWTGSARPRLSPRQRGQEELAAPPRGRQGVWAASAARQ